MTSEELKKNLNQLLKEKECLVVLPDGSVYRMPVSPDLNKSDSYKIGKGADIFLDLAGQATLERQIKDLRQERDSLKEKVSEFEKYEEWREGDFCDKIDKYYADIGRKFRNNFRRLYSLSIKIQKLDPAIIIEPVVNITSWKDEDKFEIIAATKTFPCYKYSQRKAKKARYEAPFKIGLELMLDRTITLGNPFLLTHNSLKPDVGEGEDDICAPRYEAYVLGMENMPLEKKIVLAMDYARSIVHARHGSTERRGVVNTHIVKNY